MNSKDIKSCIYFHQLIPHLHFLPSSCCCLLNNSSYFDNNDKLFVLKYKFFVPFSPYDVVQFFWELSKTAKKIVQEIWHFLSEFLSSEMPFTLVGLQLTKCKTKYTEVEIAILSQTILATTNCYYAFGNWKQPSILFWLGKGP